jgi:hypothetical protein
MPEIERNADNIAVQILSARVWGPSYCYIFSC